jgi:branched-chain amino acid transport system substrate-binding protein
VISSFHDSGFDLNYAFQLGFESAGGEVLDILVTHRPGRPGDLPAALERAAALRPAVVYASYAGAEALDFLQAYGASQLRGRAALVGGGFLTDEPLLRRAGSAALGARTAATWSPRLAGAESERFARSYRLGAGAHPDQFAALGYDTGLLVLHATALGGPRTPEFAQALSSAELAGARGALRTDPSSREVSAPLYLREVRGGAPAAHQIVRALDPIAADDPRAQALASTLRSGWLNGYLAV